MKCLLEDTYLIVQVANILEPSNWIPIEGQADYLPLQEITPEEHTIAKDLLSKTNLNEMEVLFIESFFYGYDPEEIGIRLGVSLQWVYNLFESSTTKILKLKNSTSWKWKARHLARCYQEIIRKIEITPEIKKRFK